MVADRVTNFLSDDKFWYKMSVWTMANFPLEDNKTMSGVYSVMSLKTTILPAFDNTSINTTAISVNEMIRVAEISVLALTFLLALAGNSCVIAALALRKRKTTRMHVFIFHLCVADIMVAVFNILPQLGMDLSGPHFRGNNAVCKLVMYFQVMVLYLSTYIMLATALDRYRAICYPMTNYSWTMRRANFMIVAAWLAAAIFATPQLVIFYLEEDSHSPGAYICADPFTQYPWAIKVYTTGFTLTVFIIPLVLLVVCYGRICCLVWTNFRAGKSPRPPDRNCVVYKFNRPGRFTGSLSQTSGSITRPAVPRAHSFRGYSRAKLKTVKLTLAIIVAYVLCWTPFFVTQLWWAYRPDAPIQHAVFVLCLLLAGLNSCCNPWIYLAFSGSLLQRVFPCCKKLCKSRPSRPPRYVVKMATLVNGRDRRPMSPNGCYARTARTAMSDKQPAKSTPPAMIRMDTFKSGARTSSTKLSRTCTRGRQNPQALVVACAQGNGEVVSRLVEMKHGEKLPVCHVCRSACAYSTPTLPQERQRNNKKNKGRQTDRGSRRWDEIEIDARAEDSGEFDLVSVNSRDTRSAPARLIPVSALTTDNPECVQSSV